MDLIKTFASIGVAALPALLWLWWYLRQDRNQPEPKKYLWQVFLLGMLITIPALFLEFIVDLFLPFARAPYGTTALIGAWLVVAPIEEIAKFLAVWSGVYRNRIFNERLDGIIYMVVVALGFATVENILVVLREGAAIVPLRFITATLLHILASGIVGYFLGLAKFAKRRGGWLIVAGLVLGILLHGLYDQLALLETSSKLLLIVVYLGLLYLILDQNVRHVRRLDRIAPVRPRISA